MSGNYTTQEFREKMYSDLHVRSRDTIILMCAIFIASIGLNMNATAVIIGAMLISPLMTPIVGMGFGLALYDVKMIRQSFTLLSTQVAVSLAVSTIYFSITPLTHAGSELIARTSPTVWDILIAIAGGISGVIGARKKDANNIVPGVAIATALMPPICTAGYGLANGNYKFLFGALYLFLINCIFIMLTNFIGSRIFMKKSARISFRTLSLKLRLLIIVSMVALILPATYSATTLVLDYAKKDAISKFIRSEFSKQTIINESYDEENNVLDITVVGDRISEEELSVIQDRKSEYGISSVEVNVIQVLDTPEVDGEQMKQLYKNIDKYIDKKLEDANKKKDGLEKEDKDSN